MQKVYLHGDAFMRWYVLAHAVFALGFAIIYDTWGITLPVTAAAALLFYLPERLYPGSFLTRNMAGLSLQIFVMLYIYQMHGLSEMHFFFFTSTTAMIVYQDWRCLWLGVLVIIVQHLIFAILINSGYQGLYYFEGDVITALKLSLHFALAAGQAVIASYFAYMLRQRTLDHSEYSDKLSEQSSLIEHAYAKLELEDHRKSEELQKARELQKSILPSSTLSMPGFEMAVSMETCTEVGGDYYDYYVHPTGKVSIAMGDATGHGMQAAIVVAACKSLFQTFARRTDIDTTFKLISEGIENLHVRGVYMGLTLIEIEGNQVRCISSGMPPVLYFHGQTGKISHLSEPGPFIGHSTYPIVAKTFLQAVEPGDKLLLSTDGLFERFDQGRKFLGYTKMQEVFQRVGGNTLEDVMKSLLTYSNTWQSNGEVSDDTTVLVAHFTASATAGTHS